MKCLSYDILLYLMIYYAHFFMIFYDFDLFINYQIQDMANFVAFLNLILSLHYVKI